VTAHEFLNKSFRRLAVPSALAEPKAVPQTPEETRWLSQALKLSDANGRGAHEAAAALDALVRESDASKRPSTQVMVETRRQAVQATRISADPGLSLTVVPLIATLDQHLLATLPELGKRFASAEQERAARLSAAARILLILEALGEAPRRPALRGIFGLPWRAEQLDTPLPPRLLALGALRQQLRPLFGDADAELAHAAAQLLSRIHLLMHGIYKPDENAQGIAVRLHRERHPAADHASHAIVIYPLQPQRPLTKPHLDQP